MEVIRLHLMQLDQEAAEYFLIVVIRFPSRAMGSTALLPWLAQRSTLSNLPGNSGLQHSLWGCDTNYHGSLNEPPRVDAMVSGMRMIIRIINV
jgi:hypothetical protein